jgi:hypothetical protein
MNQPNLFHRTGPVSPCPCTRRFPAFDRSFLLRDACGGKKPIDLSVAVLVLGRSGILVPKTKREDRWRYFSSMAILSSLFIGGDDQQG